MEEVSNQPPRSGVRPLLPVLWLAKARWLEAPREEIYMRPDIAREFLGLNLPPGINVVNRLYGNGHFSTL